ncbi:MAG: metallophosphoesterase [Thermoguttaceae bacterium]|nr:metallophosphoesterase [Thermoguttaceae bacterium]
MNPKKSPNPQMFSRRSFLAAAAASAGLFFIPRSVFADSPNDVVLRAAIVSDVHYKNRRDTPEVDRFERMLQFVNEYSASQPYKNFDVLMIGGDMSDNGRVDQSGLLRDSLKKYLKPETKWIFCMGNHDHWGGNRQIWEELFEQPANKRVEVNGFQFITLSCEKGTMRDGDFQYAMPWLKEQLDAACADNTNKPVFLIQHYPVRGTVYGSCPPDPWGTGDLSELLKNYPRLIDFAGHSHYPTVDPRSAWQGEYTAFGTGTMSYFLMRYDKLTRPAAYRNAGNTYVMEIHADNSVVLKVYDAVTNKFFDCVYVVAQPGAVEKFIYTSRRYETSQPPYWAEGAAAAVQNVTPVTAEITFPQAKWDDHESIVHSYRVDLARLVKDAQTGAEAWVDQPSQYEWSQYFFNDMPEAMTVALCGLNWNSRYKFTVTALNCFGKESEKTLEGAFSTPDDPEECVDQNAEKPDANVLNVTFTPDGPVNAPVNRRKTQKTVEVIGSPAYVTDAAAGAVAAVFDGASNHCQIRFTEEEYARLTNAISYTARFRLDRMEPRIMVPFGNTQVGGYNFRVNGQKKILEVWVEIGKQYHTLTTPIEEGKYYSAACVFDGKTIVVYLNGEEKVRKAVSGRITYTATPESRSFCIGSDINGKGTGEFFFPGSVVYARVYSWALTPQQVKAVSE